MDVFEFMRILLGKMPPVDRSPDTPAEEIGRVYVPLVYARTEHRTYAVRGVSQDSDGDIVFDLEFID